MALKERQSRPTQDQPQPTLATKRLWLRPLSASDAPALHAAYTDRETMSHVAPIPQSLAETSRLVDLMLIPIPLWHGTWAMAERPDGPAIGTVGYHHREDWNGRLEVGFLLARPFWGRGLMQEALAGLLDYCFDALSLTRSEATVNPDNHRAIQLVERLGFLCEGGPLRRRQKVGTEYRAQMIYGLLREDWTRRRAELGVEPTRIAS